MMGSSRGLGEASPDGHDAANPGYFHPVQNWLNPFLNTSPGANYGGIGPINNPKALIPLAVIAFVGWKLVRGRRKR